MEVAKLTVGKYKPRGERRHRRFRPDGTFDPDGALSPASQIDVSVRIPAVVKTRCYDVTRLGSSYEYSVLVLLHSVSIRGHQAFSISVYGTPVTVNLSRKEHGIP